MMVQAKCTAKCWDSRGEIFGYPFLCSPGEVYEIPSDGLLAELTVQPVTYDKHGRSIRYTRNPKGEIEETLVPKPPYIFEFDRNMTRTNEGVVVKKDYSCKKCGKDLKTLANLGRHTRMAHRNEIAQEPEAETEPVPA